MAILRTSNRTGLDYKLTVLKQCAGIYFISYCLNATREELDLCNTDVENKLTKNQVMTIEKLFESLITVRESNIDQPFVDINANKEFITLRTAPNGEFSYFNQFHILNGGSRLEESFTKEEYFPLIKLAINSFPFFLFIPLERKFHDEMFSSVDWSFQLYHDACHYLEKLLASKGCSINRDKFPDELKEYYIKKNIPYGSLEIHNKSVDFSSIPYLILKNAFLKNAIKEKFTVGEYISSIQNTLNEFFSNIQGIFNIPIFIGGRGILFNENNWQGDIFNIWQVVNHNSPSLPFDSKWGMFTDDTGTYVDGAIIELKEEFNISNLSFNNSKFYLELSFFLESNGQTFFEDDFIIKLDILNPFPSFSKGKLHQSPIKIDSNSCLNIEKIFKGLTNINLAHIQLGLQSLIRSQRDQDPGSAFIQSIIFWENLFGEQNETAFKISNSISRIYKKIFPNQYIFEEVKRLYNFRSRFIHGDIAPTAEEFLANKNRVNEISSHILKFLISNDSELLETKKSKDRLKIIFDRY